MMDAATRPFGWSTSRMGWPCSRPTSRSAPAGPCAERLWRSVTLCLRQSVALRVLERGGITVGEYEGLMPDTGRRSLQRDLREMVGKGVLVPPGGCPRGGPSSADRREETRHRHRAHHGHHVECVPGLIQGGAIC